MKKILLTILLLASCFFSTAQKELWGVSAGYGDSSFSPNDPYYFGNIIKYDINGENSQIMHEFDQVNGKTPMGRLFLASNGKLYGTTQKGGVTSFITTNGAVVSEPNGLGTIYEYDLILNKFRVVKFIEGTNGIWPQIGFIEPTPGILYGGTTHQGLKYNINTETTTVFGGFTNLVNSEFIKASDGKLYGTAIGFSDCPNSSSSSPHYNGSIIKINTSNDTTSQYDLSCEWQYGIQPVGGLIEVSPGKLYGVTSRGGEVHLFTADQFKYGTIYEFNFFTNTYTKKFDLDGYITGGRPISLTKGLNGKIYGACERYGVEQQCNNNIIPSDGTLFEYLPQTNAVNVLYNFNACTFNPIIYPTFLMQASTGDFFGISTYSTNMLFKYDATSNVATVPNQTNPNYNSLFTNNLIEICRKPAYQEILVNSFIINNGDNFTYDVNNTNATTYQWQQNNVNVTGQTTGILNLTNVTTANSGVYTCVMTNECGTTVTAPLTVTVSNLGANEVIASLEGNVKLFPNPANTFVNIELPKNIDITINELKIHDLLGKQVYKTKENNTKIDVSAFAKGVYIVSIKTNYGAWNGKFVKE